MINSRKFLILLMSLLPIAALLGCGGIMEMDRPIPPKRLLWKKNGVSPEDTSKDLTDCAQRAIHEGAVSVEQIGDDSDICMLKKGYKFFPNYKNYLNMCRLDAFRDTPSCKSWRGEYQVQEENSGKNK